MQRNMDLLLAEWICKEEISASLVKASKLFINPFSFSPKSNLNGHQENVVQICFDLLVIFFLFSS